MKPKEKRILLKSDLKFKDISKLKLSLGIFIFLFSAFSIYSIMYIFRDTFLLLSVSEDGDFWHLTSNELAFYNLFYAFISVILAQSLMISFWFNRPRKFLQKHNIKSKIIINDNRSFNWYFINWFAKLAIVYAIMFGLTFEKGYYALSFFPNYKYIPILIIIVLFLQTWLTLRINFKNSLKWMIISAGIISILAFSLSKINLVNHKKLDKILLEKCISCKYDLQLPQTDSYRKSRNKYLTKNIYIVLNSDSIPAIIVDNKIVEFTKFSQKIEWLKNQYDKYEIPVINFILHIDKRVKMEFVNKLKTEITNSNIRKISYAVIPTKLEYNKKYYQGLYVKSGIINFHKNVKNDSTKTHNSFNLHEENKETRSLFIEYTNFGNFKCNDTLILKSDFSAYIRSFIKANNNYKLVIQISNNQKFNDYFTILIKCKKALSIVRNKYSFMKFNKSFNNLDRKQRHEVRKKYPLRIFELIK